MKKYGMPKLVFIGLVLSAVTPNWGATYYIDYENGLNTNNGLSKTAAWKVHPYMAGWVGSYTHQAGDRFIFKGGIAWPNACFRMTITHGGASNEVRDYYGVDSSWYSGGSWCRPIFDMQGAQTATYNQVLYFALDAAGNITVDNIEVTGFYWSGNQGAYGNCIMFNYSRNSNLTFKNIYVHNWSHGNYPATTDDMKVFCGYSSRPFDSNSVIEYCEIDGSPNGTDAGMAAYSGCSIFRYNLVHDLSNGPVLAGDGSFADWEIYGNTIYNIQGSFDPTMHENGIETIGSGAKIYRNRIYSMNTGVNNSVIIFASVGQASAATTDYVYNNVVYGCQTGGIPLQVDVGKLGGVSYGTASTVSIYNNTFVPVGPSTSSIRFVDQGNGRIGTAIIQNNHLITGATNAVNGDTMVNTLTVDHNSIMTPAAAAAQGYASSNGYAPTLKTNGTVDSGCDLSAYFQTDISGVARPIGVAWDIGAYEYDAGSAVGWLVSYRKATLRAAIRLHGAGFTVTLPSSVRLPELTIVDLSGREVYHAALGVASRRTTIEGCLGYECSWRGAPVSGVNVAVVNGSVNNRKALLVRTMFATIK
jgi:hypothetical protein